jgi:hypothetical protein
MSRGSYGKSGDVQDHTLFDQLLFQNTTVATNRTFFTTPIGGAYGAGVKTFIETNMQDPGKLPNSQSFLIKQVSLAFVPMFVQADVDGASILSSVINIIQASLFEIKIAGREFDMQKPGSEFLPGFFAAVRSTMVDATDRPIRVGDVIQSGWLKLETPIPLGEMVSFNVTQRTGSAIAALVTILDTASDLLEAQNAALQFRLRGTLTRSK